MKIRDIGVKSKFPWPELDSKDWPGRELMWVWCHPTLAVVILCGFIGFCVSLATRGM